MYKIAFIYLNYRSWFMSRPPRGCIVAWRKGVRICSPHTRWGGPPISLHITTTIPVHIISVTASLIEIVWRTPLISGWWNAADSQPEHLHVHVCCKGVLYFNSIKISKSIRDIWMYSLVKKSTPTLGSYCEICIVHGIGPWKIITYGKHDSSNCSKSI